MNFNILELTFLNLTSHFDTFLQGSCKSISNKEGNINESVNTILQACFSFIIQF